MNHSTVFKRNLLEEPKVLILKIYTYTNECEAKGDIEILFINEANSYSNTLYNLFWMFKKCKESHCLNR